MPRTPCPATVMGLVAAFLLCLPTPTRADVTEDIADLKPGQWYEIPNSKLADAGVIPDPSPPGFVAAVMSAWSGGVYDTKRDRLLVMGGGHADYSGNEIYAFDMNSFAWSRIWGPTPVDQIPTGNEVHASYPDGNPSSRHTYHGLVYIPGDRDAMLTLGGSRWKQGGYLGVDWHRWWFDLTNLTWTSKGSANINCDSGAAYDPVSGHVFCRERYHVNEYNLTDHTLTARYRISAGWSLKSTAAIDPSKRKMVFVGGCGLAVFDLDTYAWAYYDEAGLSGDTEIICGESPGIQYHPPSGRFVIWSGERSHKEILPQVVYAFDPTTLTIKKRYPAATNTLIPPSSTRRGTYGRFRYVPSKDVFVLVNSIDQHVYVYRLSSSTTPPPGFGSTKKVEAPQVETNIHSIGIEWHLEGDDDHDATCSVQYRRDGAASWKDAMPLFRVDHLDLNMMAGSLMFLDPGTRYQVKLEYQDPDGGTWSETVQAGTRSYPVLPSGGRTFHVEPGTGGGDGSEASPFKGVDAAQSVAQPGDVFLLHAGDYGGRIELKAAGSPGKHIVWKAAGDGTVDVNGIRIQGSYSWIDGLTLRGGGDICPVVRAYGDKPENSSHGVVLTNNTILGEDNCYLIFVNPHCENWIITDNTLVGGVDPGEDTFSGEGIELWHSSGHTVAYNSITRVADGISYPGRNVDIFGNDIFDVADDGIEPDFGYANTRIWGNRITNAQHNAISLQDFDNGVPWYIVRNQIVNFRESALKTRQDGRFVFVHNTVVAWGPIFRYQPDYIVNGYARNNLLVSFNGGEMWNFGSRTKRWRTDLDYNAFDWASYDRPFRYAGKAHVDLPSYVEVSKLDAHSIVIEKDECFDDLRLTEEPPTDLPRQHLTLKSGCGAIDKGTILPNLSDDYLGQAPDIGAYEAGKPLPHYGPRTAGVLPGDGQASDAGPESGDGGPDGGVIDGAPADGAGEAHLSGGCGCHAGSSQGKLGWPLFLALLGLCALAAERRRRGNLPRRTCGL